jgi:integrase/recombinase XerD
MKEEVIIRILDQASAFLNREQIQKLKFVIEVELQHCSITQEETALAIRHNLPNRIGLFLASKKVDGMSAKTLKNYYLILNKFGQAVPKDIEQISDIDIRMYLAHYSQTGVKNSTLGTTVTALKSFFIGLLRIYS